VVASLIGTAYSPVVFRTVHKEELYVALVIPAEALARVGADAPCVEDDAPITQPAGLALDPNESTLDVEHEVVSLIGAKWEQNAIATTDKPGDDDRLGLRPDVDGMPALR
jgi:hypothetical protein